MSIEQLKTIDKKLSHALEMTEAVYWSKYYHKDDNLTCYSSIISGAFVGAVPQLDILALNRVLGLGMSQMVTTQDVESIISFYRKAGAKRFFIQLSEHTLQDDLPKMLEAAGFRLHNHWVKLMKKLDEPITLAPTHLQIHKIGEEKDKKDAYGQIIFDCFDWEDTRLKTWLCKTIGQPGYTHYLAYQEEVPIAAAALHVIGKYASLAFAGTLSSHRGMGAQRAFIEQRLLDAQEAGCNYIFSETAISTPEKPFQSYKNMIKAGFVEVYKRENWILEL